MYVQRLCASLCSLMRINAIAIWAKQNCKPQSQSITNAYFCASFGLIQLLGSKNSQSRHCRQRSLYIICRRLIGRYALPIFVKCAHHHSMYMSCACFSSPYPFIQCATASCYAKAQCITCIKHNPDLTIWYNMYYTYIYIVSVCGDLVAALKSMFILLHCRKIGRVAFNIARLK